MSMFRAFAVAIAFLFATAPAAYAYIDPVTGSFLLQGAIGGMAAILASFRSVRMRIAQYFGRQPGSADAAENDPKP